MYQSRSSSADSNLQRNTLHAILSTSTGRGSWHQKCLPSLKCLVTTDKCNDVPLWTKSRRLLWHDCSQLRRQSWRNRHAATRHLTLESANSVPFCACSVSFTVLYTINAQQKERLGCWRGFELRGSRAQRRYSIYACHTLFRTQIVIRPLTHRETRFQSFFGWNPSCGFVG